MADNQEKVSYKFTVDSDKAVKNLNKLSDALEKVDKAEKAATSRQKKPMTAGDVAKAHKAQQEKLAKQQAKQVAKTKEDAKKLQEAFQAVAKAGNIKLNDKSMESLNKYLSGVTDKVGTLKKLAKDIEKDKAKTHKGMTVSEMVDRDFAKQKRKAHEYALSLKKFDEERLKEQAQLLKEFDKARAEQEAKRAYAIKHQNDLNAGKRGAIHVDPYSKSAKESAKVLMSDEKILPHDTVKSLGETGGKLLSIFGKVSKIFAVVKKITSATKQLTGKLLDKAKQKINKISSIVSKLTGKVKGLTGHASKLRSLLKLGSGIALGNILRKGVKEAISYIETQNLFDVAMHNNRDLGKRFVGNVSEWYGLDPKDLMQYTGMFYEMAYAVGAPDDAAQKLSTSLTALSVDVASLFNQDVDTVSENLISGMRGMSRAVVKYGMDLRATTIESFAARHGIELQYESANEATREILRFATAVEQASDANSDFRDTIDEPANQLRIFQAQIVQLGRAIGSFLVEPLKRALPVINGVTMALRILLETISSVLFPQAERSAESFGNKTKDNLKGVGSAADGAKKKVKELLAPFDELNILQEKSSGSGGLSNEYGVVDPKVLDLLDKYQYKLEEVRLKALDTRDAILEFFGLKFEFDPLGSLTEQLKVIPGEFADTLIQAFIAKDFTKVGSVIAHKMNEVVDPLVEKFSWENLGPKITTKLGHALDSINAFLKDFHWESLGAAFGELVHTTIETIDFAAINFDWTALGNALARSLNSFIAHAALENVGKTLADWLNGIAEFAAELDQTFEWDAFGDTLEDTINEFFDTWEINALVETAVSIINHLLDALIRVINSDRVNWTEIGSQIGTALGSIPWGEIMGKVAEVVYETFKAKLKLKFGAIQGFFDNETTQHYVEASRDPYGTYYHNQNKGKTAPSRYGIGGAYHRRDFPMAKGGIVTGPTRALIGEGRYDEAVIPLGNSPQMNDLVNRLSQSVDNESVVAAIYNLIDTVKDKDFSVSIGDETIGHSYDRYNYSRGVRVTNGVFANAY